MIDTQALYAQQSEVTHALERDSIIRQSTALFLHVLLQCRHPDVKQTDCTCVPGFQNQDPYENQQRNKGTESCSRGCAGSQARMAHHAMTRMADYAMDSSTIV